MNKYELIDFSKRIEDLWAQAKIPYPVHISGGNEEHLIRIFKSIKPEDYIFSTHRSHYHYLLAGGSASELEAMICNGKSMHIFDKRFNFLSSSIVSGLPAVAAGTALGLKRKKQSGHVWCFVGDGAEDEGHFYEAVRYVDGWKLPCTFVLEDNNRSVETPKSGRFGDSQMTWPTCVRRYCYEPAYPHVGVGRWVDFSKAEIKPHPAQKLQRNGFFSHDSENTFQGTYKEAIDQSMKLLAEDPMTVFLGYNINYGSMAYGTLSDIPEKQKIEMPVAENLMTGLATGMSIVGFRPVVFFERHDFMLNALDAIVNHLDKIEIMSEGEFLTPVILRATVGAKAPLDPGLQHLGDYTKSFKDMILNFPVCELNSPAEVIQYYKKAKSSAHPVLFIERKELYGQSDSGKFM